jgi:N6-L-threonylcarbamoyladenine synthase
VIVLGIESSCDETAAAIVDETGRVLGSKIHSQIALHAVYGGIIPELASRDHLLNMQPVVQAALADAGRTLADIDGIATTCRPGLVGALLVGLQFGKALAWSLGKPFVGVDHLLGHLAAGNLYLPNDGARTELAFPLVALLVSGGHTALYRVRSLAVDDIVELGATRDDAVGEAFDKVGKLLGLPYPAGPHIDRLARAAEARITLQEELRERPELTFTVPKLSGLEFSFSGTKSQASRMIEARPPDSELDLMHYAYVFQRHVVKELTKKLFRAAEQEDIANVAIAGGVAANSALREAVLAHANKLNKKAFLPARWCCTDNAAMIAYVGALRLTRGEHDSLDLEVSNRTALQRVTRKGRGERHL